MESWMGRYRPLAAALVRLSNQVSRTVGQRYELQSGITLSMWEWQVLEYLYEHEDLFDPMQRVSEQLLIAQSSFSRMIQHLSRLGLIDKYRVSGNRKNVIVHISPLGRSVYEQYVPVIAQSSWRQFFEHLDSLPDADIAAFTEALDLLTSGVPGSDRPALPADLIPID